MIAQQTLQQFTSQVRDPDKTVIKEKRRKLKDILRHYRRKNLNLQLKMTLQQRQETNM